MGYPLIYNDKPFVWENSSSDFWTKALSTLWSPFFKLFSIDSKFPFFKVKAISLLAMSLIKNGGLMFGSNSSLDWCFM